MSTSTTGAALVAAFAVFLTGAVFWLVKEFERPVPELLEAVAGHRSRWIWIHSWMFAGTAVSAFAVGLLSGLLKDDGAGPPAMIAPFVFSLGCAAWMAAIVLRLTVMQKAAAELTRTGSLPDTYPQQHRIAGVLYSAHMLLSYSTFALLGLAMLQGSLLPAWVGWFGIVAGVAGVVGFLALRGGVFAPPFMAHLYGLMVGIVLLVD